METFASQYERGRVTPGSREPSERASESSEANRSREDGASGGPKVPLADGAEAAATAHERSRAESELMLDLAGSKLMLDLAGSELMLDLAGSKLMLDLAGSELMRDNERSE